MKISEIIKGTEEHGAVLIRYREMDDDGNLQYDMKGLYEGRKKGWSTLDAFTGSVMLTVYKKLSREAKKKFDKIDLRKLLDFVWAQF